MTHSLGPGSIYFISDGVAIKIGYSGAPSARMKELQTSHHRRLCLLCTAPGSERDEAALHARFAHLRLHGEWFRPDPELLDTIEGLRPAWELARLSQTVTRNVEVDARKRKQWERAPIKEARDRIRPLLNHPSQPVRAFANRIWVSLGMLMRDDTPQLRRAIECSTANLEVVMRNGGKYIPEDHRGLQLTFYTGDAPS